MLIFLVVIDCNCSCQSSKIFVAFSLCRYFAATHWAFLSNWRYIWCDFPLGKSISTSSSKKPIALMKEEFFYINHSNNLAHTNTKENKTLSLFLLYSFIINWNFQLYIFWKREKNVRMRKKPVLNGIYDLILVSNFNVAPTARTSEAHFSFKVIIRTVHFIQSQHNLRFFIFYVPILFERAHC